MRKKEVAAVRARIATVGAGIIVGAVLVAGCSSSSSKTGSKPTTTTATTTAVTTTTTTPSAVATTVNVTLSDTAGLAGSMTLRADVNGVPAGDVTFVVTNSGTIDHEMVVLKTDAAFDQLPVDNAGDPPAPVASGGDKVSEDQNVGETGDPDVKPGVVRTFTVKDMKPGTYALVCNIAKHYGLGMRAAFTVT
jgi:uncharacterized cupredoxin-like copper-binding protein